MKHAEKQKFKQPERDFFSREITIFANVDYGSCSGEKNQFLPRLRNVKTKKSTSVNINAQYAWPSPNTMTWCIPMMRKPTASESITISRSFIGQM